MRKNEANLTYKEHGHITGLNIQLYLRIISSRNYRQQRILHLQLAIHVIVRVPRDSHSVV